MNKSFVFSDVHGCGKELDLLLEPFKSGYDLYSLGDNFDRALDGVKVWEIIRDYNVRCIMGNHERKMLRYLKGEINYVPKHYYYFLNQFSKKYDINLLINFLENLPTILEVGPYILVHAGVNVYKPEYPDLDANVYGKSYYGGDWWKKYDGDRVVVYGHVSHQEPHICSNQAGYVNSICIDTSACRGNKLTGIALETPTAYTLHSIVSPDYMAIMEKLEVERYVIK